jgi:hypothetical protein
MHAPPRVRVNEFLISSYLVSCLQTLFIPFLLVQLRKISELLSSFFPWDKNVKDNQQSEDNQQSVLAFENGVLAFEKRVLAFENGVLAFENGVLAFDIKVVPAFEN